VFHLPNNVTPPYIDLKVTVETEQDRLVKTRFRVGDWLVEPRLNRLSRGGASSQIELKMMDVLVCLAGHAGELVSRQRIIDTVWTIEYISEGTLTRIVAELRRVLGDDARQPRYIETIRGKGYRLLAPVEVERQASATIAQFPVRASDDDRNPYPGLAAFTEADAEFFFGREAEIADVWRKITSRRLLGVIGPSGVGKTSFLRAGLIPAAPEGWGTLICQPGEAPFAGLARALAPQFEGDSETILELVDIGDPTKAVAVVSRWREHHEQGLLIVDQFEELFTLNPPETQARFGTLIGRLARDADVHVLLSMRDDFLYRCHEHEALLPIFSGLIPVKVPARDNLRRALIQPAARFGYEFEDEDLVDEMLDTVAGERGALPLLAFAVARLWERRDLESKLLTHQVYSGIGGVAGALAHHAEAAIDRIGTSRIAIVRELFRNLVTAEGTRAVREWDELLSVFSDMHRESADEVLRALIDARLLTSYEVRQEEKEPTRQVEIIHESLLANWPRLVRWQTQDADAVQFRDQLRQAARTWRERDRSDDLLWMGSAYREFAVWRERYSGGLSETEEAFAAAMTSLAMRRRRRRRIAVTAALVMAAVVVAVTTTLWRRSVLQGRRAEAANLLSQAQAEIESYPSAAVAYATASLDLSDSPEARHLALKALWKGPTAFVVNEAPSWEIAFTPDGRQLVQTTDAPPFSIHVVGADGTDELLEDVHEGRVVLGMDSKSGVFATIPWRPADNEPFALWSAAEKRLLSKGHSGLPGNLYRSIFDLRRRRMVVAVLEGDRFFVDALNFDGSSERLGTLPFDLRSVAQSSNAPNGRFFAVSNDRGVYLIEFGDHDLPEPRRLEYIEGLVVGIDCDPFGRFVAARYDNGQIHLWDLAGNSPPKVIHGPPGVTGPFISTDGSLLEVIRRENDEMETWIWSLENDEPTPLGHVDLGTVGGTGSWELNPVEPQVVSILNPDPKTRLWQLQTPGDAGPVIMQRGNVGDLFRLAIHPHGQWVATSGPGLTLWPLARRYPAVISRYEERLVNMVFGPEGRWFATTEGGDGTVRIWRLEGDVLPPARIVYEFQDHTYDIAASPDGKQILLATHSQGAQLISLDGEPPRALPGASDWFWNVAFSRDGRFAAGSTHERNSESRVIRVWDLVSNDEANLFDLGDEGWYPSVHFTDDGRLISGNSAGLLRWNLETGDSEVLFEGPVDNFASSSDDARVLFFEVDSEVGAFPIFGRAVLLDLGTGVTTPLTSHGDRVTAVAMDPGGTIVVTGDMDGVVRVGPVTGEEPHMLLGNPGDLIDLEVDPRGRWIAASSGTEIRLWPMPDLDKPPLHTLQHDEFIAKLKTLTNLRAVRDEESPTGWKIEVGPFPGWETVPSW